LPQPTTVVGTEKIDRETCHANRNWEASDAFMDAPVGVLSTTNKFRWHPGGSSAETLYYPKSSYYASASFKDAVGDVTLGFSERQLAIVREQIRIAELSNLQTGYWDCPSWPIGLVFRKMATTLNQQFGIYSVCL